MPINPNFAVDYICLGEEGQTSSDKKLTFIAASALSLLCYERNDEIKHVLCTDDRFRVAKDLNLLSDVWVIPNAVDSRMLQTASERYPLPLLAWSESLQTVFVGFRGTWSAADILSDINIGQSPEPNLGSRFHAGFYARASQYTTLIEQLARRYRVVVCGHSLGGAMATIATYLVLGTNTHLQDISNAWEAPHNGLSVVTFGSPAAMVVEDHASTAAPQKRWAQNFHHVINPDDAVPFALGESPKWIQQFLAIAGKAKLPNTLQVVLGILESWLSHPSRGSFVHYGCIYLLEKAGEMIQCRQITSLRQIPQTAPDASQFRRYHSMDHYAHCLGRTTARISTAPSMQHPTSMTVDNFRQDCWALPAAIRECRGVVHDNCVTISATVESRLVQFLLKKVAFKRNGADVAVSGVEFVLKADDHNQMFIKIHYNLNPGLTPAESLAVIHSIRIGVYFYDIFGHATLLPINEVHNQSLRYASVPTTFESLRLAMIIAFADQIARVQKLKLDRYATVSKCMDRTIPFAEAVQFAGPVNEIDRTIPFAEAVQFASPVNKISKHVDPTVLTEKAAQVADLVDKIVLSACPHLVVLRLEHAWRITRDLWPKPQDEERSTLQAAELPPGAWPENLSLQDCPEGLQCLISDMLNAFSERKVSYRSTSVTNWEDMGRCTLQDLMPKAPSLAVTLKNFSHGFYNRPTNAEERIEHAIRQADEVLTTIRFCHVIMLTQLDAPPDWYWKAGLTGIFGALALASTASPITIGTVTAESLGFFAGVGLVSVGLVMGMFVLGMLLVYSETQQPRELLQNFESMVEMTMQVLGVEAPPLSSIIETRLAEHVQSDIAVSNNTETLQRWQARLAEGLRKHPAIKGSIRIDPTLFWAQWLFNVARVARLRTLIASQIRIGIEGPSECGKSELLTALTGADPDMFRAGPDENCRTMEIQMYQDPGRDATFVDCPGADDKNSRIREMACLFRDMFGILIFMVPSDRIRTEAKEKALKEIAGYLRNRRPDLRPVRILLSKADQLESSRSREDVLRNSVAECKRTVISELRRLGPLPQDFVIHSRQARADGALLATETLDDIVQPFSTHAQMSDEGKKALSDCPEGVVRKIEGPSLFRSLYHLAEQGDLWDVESLREWLRGLSPNSVPDSARVWQD